MATPRNFIHAGRGSISAKPVSCFDRRVETTSFVLAIKVRAQPPPSEMTNGLVRFMTDLAGQRPNRISGGHLNPRVHRELNGGEGGIRTAQAQQPKSFIERAFVLLRVTWNEEQD
jgi:hypothetical protein